MLFSDTLSSEITVRVFARWGYRQERREGHSMYIN